MKPKEENARKALEILENDVRHTTANEDSNRQTREDDINDIQFHDLTGEVDPKWKQDKNGNWTHPDFE